MKVLLIRSQTADPSVKKVARALAESGHRVTLLLWDRESKHRNADSCNLYDIHKFPLKAPSGKVTISLYLPIWWLYELLYLLKEDACIIHACDLDTLLPAVFVKLFKKRKLCYTIYDFYADNLPTRFPDTIRKFIASLEKFLIGFTDSLFLVDETRYEQIKGSKINKLVYVYNSPIDHFNVKSSSKSTSETLVFYAGLLVESRGLRHMMEAIKDLDDVRLIVAGTGPNAVIISEYESKYPNKIRYMGWIPYEEVIEWSLCSDILFAFYDPKVPNSKYASPNKLFEAMMCGKPIIVSDGSTMSTIVRKENCGLVVPYGDIEAIKRAILRLKTNSKLYHKIAQHARAAYESRYSWDIVKDRLTKTYNEIAKSLYSRD